MKNHLILTPFFLDEPSPGLEPSKTPANPWLDAFGRSATDPDFPEFIEKLKRQRNTDTPE